MIDKNKVLTTEQKSLYSNGSQKSSEKPNKFPFFGFAAILDEKSSNCESESGSCFEVLNAIDKIQPGFSDGRTQPNILGRKNRCLPHHGATRSLTEARVNPWVFQHGNELRTNHNYQDKPVASL